MKIVFILGLVLVLPLFAEDPKAQVVSTAKKGDTITISQPEDRPWKLREKVCVSRGEKELACGKVVLSTPTEATVKLDKKKKKKVVKKDLPKPGDTIVLAPPPPPKPEPVVAAKVEVKNEKKKKVAKVEPPPEPEIKMEDEDEQVDRAPASESFLSTRVPGKRRHFNVGLGVAAGFSYIIPVAQIQYAPWRKWAFGIQPVFLSATSSGTAQKATGGLITVDYSLGRGPFLGFYAQAGGGVYWLSATKNGLEESSRRTVLSSALGYRAISKFDLNIGARLGFQYLFESSSLRLFDFKGFQPLLLVDISYSF